MQANKKNKYSFFLFDIQDCLIAWCYHYKWYSECGKWKVLEWNKTVWCTTFFRELSSTSICVRILQQIVFENCFVTKLDKSICQTANVIKILVMTETYFNSRGETIPQYFITLLNIEHLKWCFDYCLKGTNSKNFGIGKKKKHSEFGGLNVLSQTCVQLNC